MKRRRLIIVVIAILLTVLAALGLTRMIFQATVGQNINESKSYAMLGGIASTIDRFFEDKGRYPTVSEFLRMVELGYWEPGWFDDDMWGNPFVYEPAEDGKSFVVRCLGRDGKIGGTGRDGDFWVEGGTSTRPTLVPSK